MNPCGVDEIKYFRLFLCHNFYSYCRQQTDFPDLEVL